MSAPWLAHFLAPRHALCNDDTEQWHGCGRADTPGEDARCVVRVALARPGGERHIAHAGFAVFGPAVAIACADWLCGRVRGAALDAVRALDALAVERALALAPDQRYAALLAIDALNAALDSALARP